MIEIIKWIVIGIIILIGITDIFVIIRCGQLEKKLEKQRRNNNDRS